LPFTLAHLSDAHIGPLPHARRRDLIGKRITGYINWKRGRATAHDMDVLAAVVTDMRLQAPSHVAMTGDILNIGLPGEYPLAAAWLETLGAPGSEVSFTAGNHDAYTRGALPTLARTFAPWTQSDSTGLPGYPFLKVRDGVALIGLCSGVPRAPFIASGRLGHMQREVCEDLLADAGRRKLARVVMLHHPPKLSEPTGHLARGLSDHHAFRAMIGRVGADLIIHGHNHKVSVDHVPGLGKRVPIVGVPSASAVKGSLRNRAGYHLFSIEGEGADVRVVARARGLLPGLDQIGDLGEIAL
jgi:3',5'-cyclic AMP phosphodiesterase CpdA